MSVEALEWSILVPALIAGLLVTSTHVPLGMISLPALSSRTSFCTTSKGIASSALFSRFPTSSAYCGDSRLPVCCWAPMNELSSRPERSLSAGFS